MSISAIMHAESKYEADAPFALPLVHQQDSALQYWLESVKKKSADVRESA